MYNYERNNMVYQIPILINKIAKANKVKITQDAIDAIMNQLKYYSENYTSKFSLDAKIPWTVEIKEVPNDSYEKFHIPAINEYTVNIKLYKDRKKKNPINRELLFLARDGKLLAIYHYKPIIANKMQWNKKVYTIPQSIINDIKGHIEN